MLRMFQSNNNVEVGARGEGRQDDKKGSNSQAGKNLSTVEVQNRENKTKQNETKQPKYEWTSSTVSIATVTNSARQIRKARLQMHP
mmetsp:Transcript_20372/g.52164  ORF Transcript_20372/g.52164 Transcript_20372/m.52164 type:complete len:86 (+) Transcript_20372:392-649(+)